MIRCEVIESFSLKDFDELQKIERKGRDERGQLFKGDTFECSEDMAKYLMGQNSLSKTVVKVIEVEPKEKKAEEVTEEKPKKKKSKK